ARYARPDSAPRDRAGDLLHSDLDDPDLVEAVQAFTEALPTRLQAIEEALRASDLAALAQLAHQLKGAAGTFGFMPITHAASVVEENILLSRDLPALRQSVQD